MASLLLRFLSVFAGVLPPFDPTGEAIEAGESTDAVLVCDPWG